MARNYKDEIRLRAVLKAADDDLTTLLEAVTAVIQERHPDGKSAQREATEFAKRLYAGLGKLNSPVL
jgi:hypothetical protein